MKYADTQSNQTKKQTKQTSFFGIFIIENEKADPDSFESGSRTCNLKIFDRRLIKNGNHTMINKEYSQDKAKIVFWF